MANRKEAILFVDDEAAVCRMLMRQLREVCGELEMFSAQTEREALEYVEDVSPSIIVMDLCLDVRGAESGVAMIPKFLKINQFVKIIVHSANDKKVWRERCLKAGAVEYIEKPAFPDEMRNALRKVRAALF